MGSINITSIKRRQLASSVVGTPGVNNSAARGLNSLANSSFSIARKLRQNGLVTNKLQAAKEAQATEEEIQKRTSELQVQANLDPSVDPQDILDDIKVESDLIRRRRLGEVKNREVRTMTDIIQRNASVSANNSNLKWALKVQGINAISNGTERINGLATFSEQNSDIEVFKRNLVSGELVARETAAVLSVKEGRDFIEDSPKSIATGYLNGLMRRDPELGRLIFRSENIFNTIFDSGERKAIEKDFANAIDGKSVLTKQEALFSNNKTIDDIASDYVNGNLDPVKIQERKNELEANGTLTLQSRKFLDHAKEVSLTKAYLTSPDNVKIKSRLLSQYTQLQKAFKDGQIISLEKLLDFKLAVGEQTGININADTASRYLALVRVPIAEQEENFGRSGFLGGAVDILKKGIGVGFFGQFSFEHDAQVGGIEKIESYLTASGLTGDRFEDARVSMIDDMLTRIQKIKRDNIGGAEITDKIVSDVLGDVISEGSEKKGIPVVPEKGRPVTVKGVKLWLMPDGTYQYR